MKGFIAIALLVLYAQTNEITEEQKAQFNSAWFSGFFGNPEAGKIASCLDTTQFYLDLSKGREQFNRQTIQGYIDGFKQLQPCVNYIPSAVAKCILNKDNANNWLFQIDQDYSLFQTAGKIANVVTSNTLKYPNRIKSMYNNLNTAFNEGRYQDAGEQYGQLCQLLISKKQEESISEVNSQIMP